MTRQNLTSQTNSRRLKEVEAAHSNLTEQLSECKTELGRSNSVENDLKKQLNSTEEVLQSDNKEQRELSSTIHGLTKTVGLLKWAAKWLCEHPKDVSYRLSQYVHCGTLESQIRQTWIKQQCFVEISTDIIRVTLREWIISLLYIAEFC